MKISILKIFKILKFDGVYKHEISVLLHYHDGAMYKYKILIIILVLADRLGVC